VPQHLANGLLRWFDDKIKMRPYQHRQINKQKLLELAGFMRAQVEPDWPPETVLQHLMAMARRMRTTSLISSMALCNTSAIGTTLRLSRRC
jgi:hypothetical protein